MEIRADSSALTLSFDEERLIETYGERFKLTEEQKEWKGDVRKSYFS